MKTGSSAPHQRVWAIGLAALGLLVLLVMSACGSEEAKAPTPTLTPASTLAPTATPGDLEAMAQDIAGDIGKVMHVAQGASNRTIFVLEEKHNSPAIQVEIALMLNRLYADYDLRDIGLEGALSEGGSLDTRWYRPSFTAGQPIGPREDAIVQLLEDGEISAAEMMALVYADVNVAGIDDAAEYPIRPGDAGDPSIFYLYQIAVAGLTQAEILKANDFAEQGKEDEALEFILGTDEFTKRMSERLKDASLDASCEELLERTDEIKAKAAEVGAEIKPEHQEDLEKLRRFYEACSVRSDTMSKNTLALVGQSPGPPAAMQTGVGHTDRVKDRLSDAGVSFAVIRPSSYDQDSKNGDLSSEAYDRKADALSVDPPGWLGKLLDDRLKPPPVVGELWFRSKADLFLLATLAARAADRGELPPFDDALRDVLPQLQNVTLLPDTIEMSGNDVLFGVEARDRNDHPVEVWVRTTRDRDVAEQTLDDRLLAALSNVQAKEPPSGKPEPTESEPTLQRISSDTIAIFAQDRSGVLKARISG